MTTSDSPWIKIASLDPPSLQDNTADAERLVAALKKDLQADHIDIDIDLLKQLPDLLRKWEYKVRCIVFKDRHQWLLAGITAAADPGPIAGLALDLGTTRVVLRMLDLTTGRTLAESAFDNPQGSVAPDILARIHHAEQEGGLDRLNQLIVRGLNHAIDSMCATIKLDPQNIYALAVAGNTTMTHLFMGLCPRWIIREPYIPVVNKPPVVKARALGIRINPHAGALIFPNIGSYFGGDLIAGILYAEIDKKEEPAILVDVGTNAEVVLGHSNWLIACAGAAGPALEGGVTRMGMTAGPGVIDKIIIDPNTREFNIHTIEEKPPLGICGSGVIDLAAQLYLGGMLDMRGKFLPAECGSLLNEIDGLLHLTVVPADQSGTGSDLTISQADMDSLIRSKAAMYTILETITASVGMALRDLTRFYVAGTFGSFIDPRSAITIGMLPDLPLESYQTLGNSSLGGATLALTSADCLAEMDRIRDRITYLELNVNQDFMNRFSAAKFLPHTNRSLFPSVCVRQF
ncbi:MAG: ASKHA domain-containing protein [Desulfobacteraceae bacterium]|jgi:uncharacterized 2Fe-2S/4Fe-4S cluster protein (DUF4445 family)|nr:ASKHA domain-containing protein [Desulfobacteraceae bacterium]